MGKAYHDAKAQAEGSRQKHVAVLDAEVTFTGDESDEQVNVDYARSQDTSLLCSKKSVYKVRRDILYSELRWLTYPAHHAHDPASGIIINPCSLPRGGSYYPLGIRQHLLGVRLAVVYTIFSHRNASK